MPKMIRHELKGIREVVLPLDTVSRPSCPQKDIGSKKRACIFWIQCCPQEFEHSFPTNSYRYFRVRKLDFSLFALVD